MMYILYVLHYVIYKLVICYIQKDLMQGKLNVRIKACGLLEDRNN